MDEKIKEAALPPAPDGGAAAPMGPVSAQSAAHIADHRHNRRHPVRWRAAIELDGGSVAYQGSTVNVSVTGCMVLCDHNIRPDPEVRVYMQMPPVRPGAKASVLSLTAHITHTSYSGRYQGFLVGLTFDQAAAAEIRRLRDHFGEQLPKRRKS